MQGLYCREIGTLQMLSDDETHASASAQISDKLLNFRKWFKNGLKAQKLLAQGIALGIIAISKAPCKGKSLIYCLVF